MKKNITINLFGTLYNIDDDAYELLDNYLKSMKRYFGTQEGGEEIADDIEHRVAELLWEKKEQGTEAINLDIIKEIIGKIGNAEEIAGEDGNAQAEESTGSAAEGSNGADDLDTGNATLWQRFRHHFSNRRLYRDPDDQMLGGVCSGVAHYIGFGDPVLWRLVLILLFLIKGLGLLAYIVLWLIIPLARTPEDKLRMKGVRLSPNNINEQILQDHNRLMAQATTHNRNAASGCLKLIFGLLVIGPVALFMFLLLIMSAAMLGIVGGMGEVLWSNSEINLLGSLFSATGGTAISVALCLFLVLGIILFFLIRWIFGNGKPLSKWSVWALVLVIIGCVAWIVFGSTRIAVKGIELEKSGQLWAARNRAHTSRTFQPQPELDIPYLDESRFAIITNNTNRCTWSGDYPTGESGKRYLDACDYDLLTFTAEKTDTVAPGVYTLTALVRAEDDGAFLYAITYDNDSSYTLYTESMQHIPAYGNKGGNLWKWACGSISLPEVSKFYPHLCTDSIRKQIAQAHDGKGFGWQLMCIKGIKVKEGQTISYGITTDPERTNEIPECDWVSATDFVLTATDKKAKK